MKEKLPGLFRPLMKFNVTAVMVIILMFSVFNVFSIVRTQQRQASLQTMALSQASQQIGDFIASAEQLGIVVQIPSSWLITFIITETCPTISSGSWKCWRPPSTLSPPSASFT